MKKILFVSVAALVLAAGCSSEPTKKADATPQAETTTKPTEAPKTEAPAALTKDEVGKFVEYSSKLKGGTFIKTADVKNGSQAQVDYFANYQDFKKAKPDSNLKEEDFKGYFSTGDAVNKILMEESTRLFKEFPNLGSVNINIPFEGKTSSVELDKKSVEDFFGVKFAELNADKSNEKWKEQISNKHFTKQGREQFVQKFVKVK
ncbi:hypothetical protein [Paenibacillus sp. RC84]|uniref:hypothetical protein n=1 Tax=Paenibacillus sp. RC84 TaxID=3156252 RepID=UPI003516B460